MKVKGHMMERMSTFTWQRDAVRLGARVTRGVGVLAVTLPLVLTGCAGKQGQGGSGVKREGISESSLRGVVKGQRVIGRVEVLTWVIDDGMSQTAAVGAGAVTGKTQPGPDEKEAGSGGSGGSAGGGGSGGGKFVAPASTVRDVGTLPLETALAEAKAVPWPLSAQAAAILGANGIQAVAVPLKEIDGLQKRLRIAGPLRQQFFAQSPRWTEVYRGPMADGVHPIQLVGIGGKPDEMSSVEISRGNFRLLLRNWLAPGEMVGQLVGEKVGEVESNPKTPRTSKDDSEQPQEGEQVDDGESLSVATGVSAEMRVDLVPQHFDRAGLASRNQGGFTPQRAPTVGELGVTIEPLMLEVTLKGDMALVLYPTGASASSQKSVQSGEEGSAGEEMQPGRMLGPDVPALPTLGEAMFSDALVGGPGRARAVLIVIPTLPEFFGGV